MSPLRRVWVALFASALGVAGCGVSNDGTEPIALPDGMVMVDGTVMMMMPDGAMVPADVPQNPRDAGVDGGPAALPPNAVLELNVADLWAQPLPEGAATVRLTRGGAAVALSPGAQPSVYVVELRDPAEFELSVEASDHRPVRLALSYDGSARSVGVSLRPGDQSRGAGLSLAHASTTVGGREVPLHKVFVGLRHLWFAANGRPARRGNTLDLLMDGEEAWRSVHRELGAARQSVHMATWWWESNFELIRDAARHTTMSAAERQRNTILSLLEASPARKRVMVGQFLSMDGVASDLSTDAPLRAHGTTANDNFETMGQANATRGMFNWEPAGVDFGGRVRASGLSTMADRFDSESLVPSDLSPRMIDLTHWPVMVDVQAASYHQKFAVLDGRVAFIGGMNLRRVDWDTSNHLVFEPRRMLFDSSNARRAEVASHDRLPDTGPRKDYMVRIEGPLVRDAEDVFRSRWQYLLSTNARYSADATGYALPAAAAPVPGGVQAQVTATLPSPFNESAIAESWVNAVRQAREYIFIEDQYFRMPMVVDEIVRRMNEVPTLRLTVITKPISEWTDPGCAWTRRTHEQLLTRFASRYQLLQLRAFDTQVTFGFDETDAHFVDMDVHSKLLIVDDVFLSVGSCNKNNRGIVYEGELNVAVFDRAWVRAARRRVLANMLPANAALSDDPVAWFDSLAAAARYNDTIRANWTAEGDDISLDGRPLPTMYAPRGFLYTLPMRQLSQCLIEDIGPDMV
ncbi:MAG: hypothetical protein JNK72_13960 [Myxococcales bacterium]|nr:hypothetical protein [Myxococcales bacterium]